MKTAATVTTETIRRRLFHLSADMVIHRKANWMNSTVEISVVHRTTGVRSTHVTLPKEVVQGNDVGMARIVADLADEVDTLVQAYEKMEGR